MTPKVQTASSAGADLHSSVDIELAPFSIAVVPTGYLYHVEGKDTVGLVKGRSSLAFKHKVFAFEGTIDSDFVGQEVKVLLSNQSKEPFQIRAGDRIAQIVITYSLTSLYFKKINKERTGGFGSTNEEVEND